MSFRAALQLLIVFALAASLATPLAAQQQRRSLFEYLFGGDQESSQQQQEQPQQRQQPRSRPQQSPSAPEPAPRASAPPDPAVEKEGNARRVAVFGDSLAADVARALERLYEEDPNVIVIGRSQGSSGFVRNDYYDWNAAISEEIAADSFDIAVVAIGINDRQALNGAEALSEEWRQEYRARIDEFLTALRSAGKQVIWLQLPPMQASGYGAAMTQISAIHEQAVEAAGGEWIETYERFMGESGGYTATGPDLNGNIVTMRNDDGIHFSSAGSDKLAFYIDRAIGGRRGVGGSTMEVTDLLAGTDAAEMERPPFQGLGQVQMGKTAGIVQQIGGAPRRANTLIDRGTPLASADDFDIETMLVAPAGRVDNFGSTSAPGGVENPTGR